MSAPTPTTSLARPEEVAPDQESALEPAKPAVGNGSVPFVAQLLAVLVIALGVVVGQHALVRWGWVGGPSWTRSTLSTLDKVQHDELQVLLTGILAIVLGVVLLLTALRRRPRRGLQVAARTGVDLRERDLARMSEALLSGAGAVTGARVRATRRVVRVRAASGASTEQNDAVRDDVQQRLEPLLSGLARRPRLKVTVQNRSQ